MKLKSKILLASVLAGLSLASVFGQTAIPVGNQALLNGWDFDNILSGTIAQPSRGRYSDVFGNNSSPTALTAPGGIYFNGLFGSDSWGTVAKNATGDINRDILTRAGSGSTFDLGGQTGQEGALIANVVSADTFSINLHMLDAANSFESLYLSLWGRDTGNTAEGVSISWAYSIDGGVTSNSTGLTSTWTGNAFSEQTVDFAAFTALNGVADVYLLGTVIESIGTASLNLDNIGAYAISAAAIPEPSTYAAIMGAVVVGVAMLRRRRAEALLA